MITLPHTPGVFGRLIFAGHVTVGNSLSITVIVIAHEVVLPEASVAIKVLVVSPTGKELPEGSPVVCSNKRSGQLSLNMGLLKVTTA